ncbi:hypothetical protein GY45DRAFT_1327117 [Cubamyces sp. BRFM 1775]|nr:hypothetical protein GY45DRAFT_1327117 [Cubamyces sp. BRFM 1775]
MSLPGYHESSTEMRPVSQVNGTQANESQASLPSYSRRVATVWDVPPAEQVHCFYLTAKKTGIQWLTLSLTSRAASAVDTPTFYQGGDVTGSVKLDLEKEESVDEITIALYGRLSIFSHSTSNFLYASQTLYSAASEPHNTHTATSFLKRGKLRGHHEWPYSLRLPKGVSIMSSITTDGVAERENYRLPPSFTDAEANVDVQYLLVVRVNRGGFKSGDKLSVPLTYIPLARPSPPSILRQLAYRENTPLVGPEGDPDGWKALAPTQIKGMLFKTVPVEAECRVHVSKPLSYTRGAPVHLLISISCSNGQLLDLITPQSVRLALVQRITFGDATQKARFSERLPAQLTVKAFERASASWWKLPSPTTGASASAPTTKAFAGELLIPEDLVPGCQILHYGHEYELCLYPFNVVGFTPSTPQKKPLLSERVGIVTAFAQAPRPLSYIPPQYDT